MAENTMLIPKITNAITTIGPTFFQYTFQP